MEFHACRRLPELRLVTCRSMGRTDGRWPWEGRVQVNGYLGYFIRKPALAGIALATSRDSEAFPFF